MPIELHEGTQSQRGKTAGYVSPRRVIEQRRTLRSAAKRRTATPTELIKEMRYFRARAEELRAAGEGAAQDARAYAERLLEAILSKSPNDVSADDYEKLDEVVATLRKRRSEEKELRKVEAKLEQLKVKLFGDNDGRT